MAGDDGSTAIETRRVRVQGLVQGVGYRHSCAQRARALGVSGWVRNRGDGSVEALVQGPPAMLDRLCAWMEHEVPGARVDRLTVEPAPPHPRLEGFEQRPSA